MKKKFILFTASTVIVLLLFGIAKLYISYNLSYYAGYYVQQLPRKEGTNPEMALLLENLDFGPNVEVDGITYDTDGNGTIIKDGKYYVSYSDLFELNIWEDDKRYFFNKDGSFKYYVLTSDYTQKHIDSVYQNEAQLYLDDIFLPILEAQPKPSINLQWLFNQKYEKRFN
ncbi:hypothetical protein [Streptococcus fryi]